MELLVFGHSGVPVLVFPSSCGRFFEFEEFGMVESVGGKIDAGHLQLFCVDSVDAESWYNREVPPRWRIARHVQYEEYILREVLPLIDRWNGSGRVVASGCSFGGYHAASIAFRHPSLFLGCLSMSGIFDPTRFLGGYYDQDCYYHTPPHFLAHTPDGWWMDRYHENTYVLATGEHDQCWDANERFAHVLRKRGIPYQLNVWGGDTGHDWPWWRRMFQAYI